MCLIACTYEHIVRPCVFRCPVCTVCPCMHDCSHVTVCMCTATCIRLWVRVLHLAICLHVEFFWLCMGLCHVARLPTGCLLSVSICWSVFFPLNHWWDCNLNAGPPIYSPTSCYQLASSQCRSHSNKYTALTKHRRQTCPGNWKTQLLVTKWTKQLRNK